MKTLFYTTLLFLNFSLNASANQEPTHHLRAANAELAKAAVASYREGHFRFLQEGQLVEAQQVDESKPSCLVESGKMTFDPDLSYALESTRNLDPDSESGEIELNFETRSEDPESYFQIYCFQASPGANLETARQGLKSVFEFE